MIVDVDNFKKLKMAVVARFNRQLLHLQLGHPYKVSKDLQRAIDLIEYLEMCDGDEKYEKLITYYINKLQRDFK